MCWNKSDGSRWNSIINFLWSQNLKEVFLNQFKKNKEVKRKKQVIYQLKVPAFFIFTQAESINLVYCSLKKFY